MDRTALWANLKPYGDLMSVGGALIIFFSWVLTNIVGERLKSAKASAADARTTRRLFTTLYELKVMIEGVAAQVIYTSTDVINLANEVRNRDDPARAARDQTSLKSKLSGYEIATRRINADQIDHGLAFCDLALQAAGEERTGKVEALWKARETMADLKRAKDDMFSKAEQARRAGEDPSVAMKGLSPLIAAFGAQLEIAVATVNNVADARQADVRRIGRQADLSRRTALSLYVLGTVLILAGTALTKLVK